VSTFYNRIAGVSLDRVTALSDGIFAFAMTLLALNLAVPASEAIYTEHDLWTALGNLSPHFVAYLMSFMTLGIFWVGQQTQLNLFAHSDRNLSWIHLGFLLAVTLMPFSTALLAQFITFRTALAIYWLNILLLGVILQVSWMYASHAKLVKDDTSADVKASVPRRIISAQSLYAAGALLCVFSTYWSIAAIVLVQLNYVFAPRISPLYRL
jgi:uncharacterized membrane protein